MGAPAVFSMPLSFWHSTVIILTVLTVAWTYEVVGNATYAEHMFGAYIATRDNDKTFKSDGPFRLHVIVIGDLHGDLENTKEVLEFAGVMDKEQRWIGQDAILVQLGDVMDRGPHPKAIIQLLSKLRKEAAKKKGQVFLLFGNHEFFNLLCRWGDVSDAEKAQYESLASRRLDLSTKGVIGKIWANNFFTALRLPLHPSIGKPNTPYDGEKHSIFSHSAIAFVHGGLSPNWPDLTPFPKRINEISQTLLTKAQNALKKKEYTFPGLTIEEYDFLRDDNSPLWYRGWANKPKDDTTLPEEDTTLANEPICMELDDVLKKTGTKRMIMGHTIVEKITTKCNGKIILVDTGISKYVEPSPTNKNLMSALDIVYEIALEDEHGVKKWVEKETYTAIYGSGSADRVLVARSKRYVPHP